MSRYDIVTGRENEDSPSVEDVLLATGKKLEMLTDSMQRSKLESFVDPAQYAPYPGQYVPYQGQHTSSPERVMMRMIMPTGRQYMIPVQEASVVTGSRDIFLQIRIPAHIAEEINHELRDHDPHYMSTQSFWEQEDQRMRARRRLIERNELRPRPV